MTTSHHTTTQFVGLANPFTTTAIAYLSLAIFGSLFSALGIAEIYYLQGIEWIRIHLVTLGVIIQFLYGYLPQLSGDTRPNWILWAVLNTGIITFLVGRAWQYQDIMLIGGIILFLATMMLFHTLLFDGTSLNLRSGKLFYLTGIGYFFLGIILGTGIWLEWGQALAVVNILEVHIHANNWGLLSFVFAGLFLDRYKDWFGVPLLHPERFRLIYWLLVAGALGLVVGPWVGSLYIIVPGLLLHLIGSGMIVYQFARPLKGQLEDHMAALHVISAYFWFFAPVFIAPLVIAGLRGVPGRVIEARAPEVLIFGWALHIVAFVLINQWSQGKVLHWHPVSLLTLHLGSLSIWISIFTDDLFYSMGYLFYAIAIVPLLKMAISQASNPEGINQS